ncbi:PfkB family carbohydrate kinase [Anaeropeptidivorans aminofermentans]|jgi:ribokinase|uniref:PfkB family carbohydrate kinase n=1 Tax=Anaeropeptidivorans aminofermentans TaxID=2934315 RepID=UPI002025A806|nr:PfkB family carbohydrate kinase [Anaeropeptidivorans aminofermentans]MBE6012556.1 LacI family DNA-binding transcriptional regulator [Lachnospiraceae bacterium]
MNIREIAALANVSPSTVSKILNNKSSSISEATKKRVLKVVRENNYLPRLSITDAGHIAASRLIGIFGTFENFSITSVKYLEKALSAKGYGLVVCGSKASINQNVFSGLILTDPLPDVERYALDTVTLCCFENDSSEENIISIAKDDVHFGTEAAKLCLEMGFSHIGLAFEKKAIIDQKEFIKGVNSTLKKNAVFAPAEIIYDGDFGTLIHKKIEVIICESQNIAQKLYSCARDLNLEIGKDISVLCITKTDERIFAPPLTYCLPDDKYYWEGIARFITEKIEKVSSEDSAENIKRPAVIVEQGESFIKKIPDKKVVVLGGINLDTIMHMPEIGVSNETTLLKSVNTYYGGKGANQAVGLVKLGCSPYLIGSIGQDKPGYDMITSLRQLGVNIDGVTVDSSNQTGKAYITVSSDGESAIYVYSGANGSLSKEHLVHHRYLFSNAEFCLISTEIDISIACLAAKLAKEHKTKVVIKPAAMVSLVRELVEGVYLFIPNHKEAENLMPGLSLSEKADRILEMGAENVIITLGEKGCYFKNDKEELYYKSSDFAVVDTTGGADAFISALTANLCSGASFDIAIKKANYAAGYCVSRHGVQDSLISKELLDLIS